MTTLPSAPNNPRAPRLSISPDIRRTILLFLAVRLAYTLFTVITLWNNPIVDLSFPPNQTVYRLQPVVAPDWGRATRLLINSWYRWDTGWYLKIAAEGYAPDDGSIIFPPLYPLLIRLLAPVCGGNYLLAGLIISHVCAMIALVQFYRLARDVLGGEPPAWRAIELFLVFPTAYYLAAAYTESLFLALLLTTWRLAQHEHWVWAALTALLLSLTRQQGAAMVPPLLWLVLAGSETLSARHVGQEIQRVLGLLRRHEGWQMVWSRIGAGAWLPIVAPILVYIGYDAWLSYSGLGDVSAAYVAHWDMQVVLPWQGIISLVNRYLYQSFPPSTWFNLIMFLLALGLSILALFRQSPAFSLYIWGTLGLVMMRDYLWPLGGFPRYTLALFPLFFLVASARLSRRIYLLIVALCLSVQTVLFWVFLNWGMVS